MADTVDVVVKKSEGWKEVISSGGGFFSASKSCQYCFAQSQPVESFYGHRLVTFELTIYWIPAFEKMYVKADQDLVLVVSEELEVVQRIFITVNGVDEYFTFQNTKTFPNDFDLSIDAVLPTTATTVTLFGQTASADHYIKALSTGFVSINIDTSVVTSTVLATKDNKQRRYGVRVVGDDFIFTEDGATIDTVTDAVAAAKTLIINALCQSNGADFFNKTPSDPILTDLTTASNSVAWQLNRALPATTEQSADGTNLLTYVGAPKTELFTFNQNTNRWVGVGRVINGVFNSDTDWIKGTGWTISGGTANAGVSAANSFLRQEDILDTGEDHEVSFEISNYSGSGTCGISAGSFAGMTVSENGAFNFIGVALEARLSVLARSSNEFSIDNLLAKRFIKIA